MCGWRFDFAAKQQYKSALNAKSSWCLRCRGNNLKVVNSPEVVSYKLIITSINVIVGFPSVINGCSFFSLTSSFLPPLPYTYLFRPLSAWLLDHTKWRRQVERLYWMRETGNEYDLESMIWSQISKSIIQCDSCEEGSSWRIMTIFIWYLAT